MTLRCFIVYDGLGVITVNLYNMMQILIFFCSFFFFGKLMQILHWIYMSVPDHLCAMYLVYGSMIILCSQQCLIPWKEKKKKKKDSLKSQEYFLNLFFNQKNILDGVEILASLQKSHKTLIVYIYCFNLHQNYKKPYMLH